MRRTILTISIALWLLASCAGENTPQIVVDPGPDKDAIVLANAQLVREAADAFAAVSGGGYPADVGTEQTPGGQTLSDLLPDGALLVNPYTGEATEPRDGAAAGPGEIGWEQVWIDGVPSSFLITAWGELEEIATIDNFAEMEAAALANAYVVRDAAEAFAAENHGIYPSGTGAHLSRAGHTLIDLLPEGRLLVNPYHLATTSPVDGAAANRGEVGYVPVNQNGFNMGYSITALGYSYVDLIVELSVLEENNLDAAVKANCYRLLLAVEAFAAANAGVYPNNIGVDTNLQGDTVIDLLGGALLPNPYTEANTEPSDGAAASPGQTGYWPVQSGAGFVITGFGETETVLELTHP